MIIQKKLILKNYIFVGLHRTNDTKRQLHQTVRSCRRPNEGCRFSTIYYRHNRFKFQSNGMVAKVFGYQSDGYFPLEEGTSGSYPQ